jgi:transcription antitermination factor NusG
MTLATLHDDPELRRLAAASVNARAAKNPFEAEIRPGCTPRWHVIATHPAAEKIASGHLIARRFGIYLPEFDKREVFRGVRRERHQIMFPGYIFCFVWDVMAHWRRIRACAGVSRVMLDGDWPMIVPDHVIDEIQGLEIALLIHGPAGVQKVRYRRKGWRKEAEAPKETGSQDVTISTRSYWKDLASLDDNGRNRLLHKALGLAS